MTIATMYVCLSVCLSIDPLMYLPIRLNVCVCVRVNIIPTFVDALATLPIISGRGSGGACSRSSLAFFTSILVLVGLRTSVGGLAREEREGEKRGDVTQNAAPHSTRH